VVLLDLLVPGFLLLLQELRVGLRRAVGRILPQRVEGFPLGILDDDIDQLVANAVLRFLRQLVDFLQVFGGAVDHGRVAQVAGPRILQLHAPAKLLVALLDLLAGGVRLLGGGRVLGERGFKARCKRQPHKECRAWN
jgi:hypothetical protein